MPDQRLIFLNGINKAYPKDRSKELYDEMVKRAADKQAAIEAGELPDLPPSPLHQYDLPQPAQAIQPRFAELLMSHYGPSNTVPDAISYMKGIPTLTNSHADLLGILANPTGKKEQFD